MEASKFAASPILFPEFELATEPEEKDAEEKEVEGEEEENGGEEEQAENSENKAPLADGELASMEAFCLTTFTSWV